MPPTSPLPRFLKSHSLGRSNVGKSSVINSLVGTKLARTSSTPGRTRSINFFEIRWPGKPRPEVIFADLPGYGYAKISREISAEWPKFIEPYLNERPTWHSAWRSSMSMSRLSRATANSWIFSAPRDATCWLSLPRVTACPTIN